MPKTKISEYSTTNSDNTDIESINIAEGCAPSGINNAIRELMVHLKEFQTGSSGDPLTVAGAFVASAGVTANTLTLTGILTASGGTILSSTNTLSGSNIISGNINSSGTTNTFSGGNIFSGTNTISGSAIISGNINSSGTNTFSGSNVMSFGGGTSASPSIYFASDTNTGVFSPAADTVAISTGGSERVRVDSSGNVGIGTNSPGYVLEVYGATNASQGWNAGGTVTGFAQANTSNADFRIGTITNHALGFYTNSIERARIDSSGNVGIGVTPNAWSTLLGFDMSGGASLGSAFNSSYLCANSYFNGSAWKYRATAASMQYEMGANGHIWYTAPSGTAGNSITFTERMRIDSSGNVLVGTTSNASSAKIKGQVSAGGLALELTDASTSDFFVTPGVSSGVCRVGPSSGAMAFYTANSERARITSGGEVYIAGTTDQGAYNLQCNGTGVWGAGAYVNGSDARIKEDVAPIDSGLDVVEKLNPVTYRYKEDWSKDQSVQTGFIAQELLTALDGKNYVDGIVQQGGSEGYYSVAYQNIIPILTKAIQELKAELDATKAEVAVLKGQ